MLQVSLRCTSLRRRKTSHCLGESTSLALGPIQITTLIITSNICECRIVATAFMIKSTLGLSMVDPMNMELMVEDFLSSILFRLTLTKFINYDSIFQSFNNVLCIYLPYLQKLSSKIFVNLKFKRMRQFMIN